MMQSTGYGYGYRLGLRLEFLSTYALICQSCPWILSELSVDFWNSTSQADRVHGPSVRRENQNRYA